MSGPLHEPVELGVVGRPGVWLCLLLVSCGAVAALYGREQHLAPALLLLSSLLPYIGGEDAASQRVCQNCRFLTSSEARRDTRSRSSMVAPLATPCATSGLESSSGLPPT